MQIEMMPTDRLVPYIRNARTHSADQVAQIAASIAEFGFTNPILIGEDEVIIAGHGRLQAARSGTWARARSAVEGRSRDEIIPHLNAMISSC
jgi:ParB-like chromosome segregation protein Spo0J